MKKSKIASVGVWEERKGEDVIRYSRVRWESGLERTYRSSYAHSTPDFVYDFMSRDDVSKHEVNAQYTEYVR